MRRVGRTRLTVAFGLVLSLLTMALASLAVAGVPSRPAALDSAAFELIVGADEGLAALHAGTPPPPRAPLEAIPDFPMADLPIPDRPEPAVVVAPRVVRLATPTPRPAVEPAIGDSHRVSGHASWYCKTGVSICTSGYPGGLYAAAGSEIRVGNWRGRPVRVCANGRCVSVKLVDWCACGGPRIIDLYSDAFQRLAPLSSGTVKVTVSW